MYLASWNFWRSSSIDGNMLVVPSDRILREDAIFTENPIGVAEAGEVGRDSWNFQAVKARILGISACRN
jgi:hypothetical protein